MFIANYVKHNIYKVDMATKQVSVFAHEPQMNQPNDIAIDNKNKLTIEFIRGTFTSLTGERQQC